MELQWRNHGAPVEEPWISTGYSTGPPVDRKNLHWILQWRIKTPVNLHWRFNPPLNYSGWVLQ
jgi:hypothetical protein